jgi:ubiquitin carboxyl-terminal hydrolase 10
MISNTAQLPWLSVPEAPFPARVPRRRRKTRTLQSSSVAVELPSKDPPQGGHVEQNPEAKGVESHTQTPSEPQTPSLSGAQSAGTSTQPTTPSSAVHPSARSQSQSKGSKPAVPVVPVVPVIPGPSGSRQGANGHANHSPETPKSAVASADSVSGTAQETTPDGATEAQSAAAEETKPSSPPRATPKSWADLVRSKALAKGAGASGAASAVSNGVIKPKSESLAHVLATLGDDVSQYSDKVAFLEPRGLVNTGNMCYMNSVLQILVSCVPFYQFLDLVGRRASHSFQSEVPLIDAM